MARVPFLLLFAAVTAATLACDPAVPAAPSPDESGPSPTNKAPETPVPEIPRIAPPPPTPARPIYLLDSNFTHFSHSIVSRIIAIDPDLRTRTIGGLTTRCLPDAAISPDGALMYVADSYRPQVTRGERRDVLSAYRLGTSSLVKDDTPADRRLLYKGIPSGEALIFLSQDGARIFLMKYGEPDEREIELAAYDSATLEILWEGDYPACDHRLIVGPSEWTCANTSSESSNLSVSIDVIDAESGRVSRNGVAGFTVSDATGVVGAALSPDGRRGYFVTRARRDGVDSNIALTSVDLTGEAQPHYKELDVPLGLRFAYDEIVASPDSGRLYLGFVDTVSGFDTISEVRVFDATTLKEVSALDLGGSAIDLAISNKGDHLYVLSAVSQTLAVYDATSLALLGTVQDLGGTPARILVPRGP